MLALFLEMGRINRDTYSNILAYNLSREEFNGVVRCEALHNTALKDKPIVLLICN